MSPGARVDLVLLPGMDGTAVMFGPLLAALPPEITPHVVEYPTTGPNGYDDLLPLVERAVAALPECVVLGWSFSGPLALRVAARHPDRVRGVILCASFVVPPMSWLPWLRPLLATPFVAAMRFCRRLPIWLLRAPDDPLRAAKAQLWQRVPGRTLAARARAIARVDVRAELRACQAPVLYLAGSSDRIVRTQSLDTIRRERPATAVATIRGGHFALFSDAAAAVPVIATFTLDATGPSNQRGW